MKRKKIEQLKPTGTDKKGWVATVQTLKDIVILNIHLSGKLKARYCMNTETYEYEFLENGAWYKKKIGWIFKDFTYKYYSVYNLRGKLKIHSKEEEEILKEALGISSYTDIIQGISYNESTYQRERSERREENRTKRVQELQSRVPEVPDGIKEWIFEKAGNEDYLFWEKEIGAYRCTSCGRRSEEKRIQKEGGKPARHNDRISCPHCGKQVQIKKRIKKAEKKTAFALIQPIGEDISVARHFDVAIHWENGEHKVNISEAVRVFLNKKKTNPKYICSIWYNQYTMYNGSVYFDKGNTANRRTREEYLYQAGIREALEGTWYEDWTRAFEAMAAAGFPAEYNRLMASQKRGLAQTVEYLFKGRFYRLVKETAQKIDYFAGYFGGLNVEEGASIEEVLGIQDRQLVNRLREIDGGYSELEWLRDSEITGKKIPQETLEWLCRENIGKTDLDQAVREKMSLQQVMNYVRRQQKESYKGKSAKSVLNQWSDYLDLCRILGKNTEDEMVYRPRELKRRHEEAVEENNRIRAIEELKRNKERREEEAERMRKKFPGAEEVLRQIRDKYEYANEDFTILVPQTLLDIVTEGQALHHCAGATDRYFDRIVQQETYICFMRRTGDPETPYYTIEVEPSGTIRQHRSYYDEEPGIEEIRSFLREWQKVIRKRLNEEDRRLADISKKKREQNIEELKEKNNTRVLNGLMEDFMEAV